MSAKSTTLVGIVVAVLIIGAIASIGYYQFEVAPNQTTSTTPTTSQTSVTCTKATCAYVNITSGAGSCIDASNPCGFSPLVITVVMGTNNTVFWTNTDSGIHTVTGTNTTGVKWGDGVSDPLSAGQTIQYTFPGPGTYTYACLFHAGMIGKVIVKPS